MITLNEPAYAKLNLTLDVLGRRADGYHDLKSVMQTVSLCDDVEVQLHTGEPWKVECDAEGVPCDHRNLVWKAARVFFDATKLDPDGLTIRIVKRIPSQAGMGGGSSDAAAVLRCLNRYYGDLFTPMALAELGAAVGSDVPFCVVGGTVMCEGRGERLRPITAMPDCSIVICKPSVSMSTPELFRQLDQFDIIKRPDNDAMERALAAGEIVSVAALLCNVFDPLVANAFPVMDEIRRTCVSFGALGCQMSGSGSAFFAIMPDADAAHRLCQALSAFCPDVFLSKPV